MLDFSTRSSDREVLVLTLEGDLDHHTHQDLFDCVEGLINQGNRRIIIDCESLKYVSSIGLGTLVRIHARMKKHGGDVKIANLRGAVADLFAMTGVGRMFAIYDLLSDAEASFDHP